MESGLVIQYRGLLEPDCVKERVNNRLPEYSIASYTTNNWTKYQKVWYANIF